MSMEESLPNKSPLDKPLHLLTEDDISQLTREDCRRYLKDKGMRRPSWNKSQAIQQVISLKTLLETTPDGPDAGGDIRRRLCIPRPPAENLTRVQKGTSADTEISVSAEESVPYRPGPHKPDLTGDLSGHLVAADDDSVQPGVTGVSDEPVGQMTIFYCGKVNVYDDVPADKARALMQFASSPLDLPNEAPFDGTTVMHSLPYHLQAPCLKVGPDSSAILSPTLQAGGLGVRMTDHSQVQREENNIYHEDNAAEGTAIRKASVQRYLEKRKDRFKSKRKVGASACAGLDIYLSHQMGNQNPNEQSSRSDTCSPPPVKPPNTPNRCS